MCKQKTFALASTCYSHTSQQRQRLVSWICVTTMLALSNGQTVCAVCLLVARLLVIRLFVCSFVDVCCECFCLCWLVCVLRLLSVCCLCAPCHFHAFFLSRCVCSACVLVDLVTKCSLCCSYNQAPWYADSVVNNGQAIFTLNCKMMNCTVADDRGQPLLSLCFVPVSLSTCLSHLHTSKLTR